MSIPGETMARISELERLEDETNVSETMTGDVRGTKEVDPMVNVAVRMVGAIAWKDYRTMRHEMLESDPEAFPPQAFSDLLDPKEKWEARTRSGDVMIAYDKNRPIGMTRVTYEGDTATLRNMYMNAEYRGKGLSKRLMAAAMSTIEYRQTPVVELEVEDTQLPARSMYKKFGFNEVKRVSNEKGGFMITMQKEMG